MSTGSATSILLTHEEVDEDTGISHILAAMPSRKDSDVLVEECKDPSRISLLRHRHLIWHVLNSHEGRSLDVQCRENLRFPDWGSLS